MKNILLITTLLVFSLFPFNTLKAQFNIDPETKKITFQETVAIDTLNKEQLFQRATDWMTNWFKTNKFDVNDKVNSKITHEGTFEVSYTYDFKYKSINTVIYNLTLNVKDGKYRYTITDFKVYDNKIGPKSAQTLEVYFQKMKTDNKKEFTNNFTIEINKLVEDLKKNMATGKKKEAEGEDW